ncbi:MAG TPA: nitroreductase/quinone reductase family protein [Gaiellaceae bacterium]|nr:nitroreductase/quinone reductase family protein [Gaiellaceae bacterium]
MASPYLKPGFLLSRVVNPLLMTFRVVPTLRVRGRTSGEWRTVPVNVLEREGARYLVAPRGDTQWARNLRAAGSGELRIKGRTEAFSATEVADTDKQPIVDAYLARWGSQVKSQFAQLPDPAAHPVFRIDPSA